MYLLISQLIGVDNYKDTEWGILLIHNPRGVCSLGHLSGGPGLREYLTYAVFVITPTPTSNVYWTVNTHLEDKNTFFLNFVTQRRDKLRIS